MDEIKEKRVDAACLGTKDGDAVLSSLMLLPFARLPFLFALCECEAAVEGAACLLAQRGLLPLDSPSQAHSFPCFLREVFPARTAHLIADAPQKLTDQRDGQAPLMWMLRILAMIFALLYLC